MDILIAFGVGMLLGMALGVLLMALARIAKERDT